MIKDRIEDVARNILGELNHDCPGCLQNFIMNIIRTEADTNSTLVAWSAERIGKEEVVRLVFANKQGKIVEEVGIERENH